jgi:hypothetical protein
LGTWLSLCPFSLPAPFIQGNGNSQGLNPYSYILNNPLAGVEPTGYMVCDLSGPTCGGLPGDSEYAQRHRCELQPFCLSTQNSGNGAATESKPATTTGTIGNQVLQTE